MAVESIAGFMFRIPTGGVTIVCETPAILKL